MAKQVVILNYYHVHKQISKLMMLKVCNTAIIRFVVAQTLAVVQFPVQFESIVPRPDT